MAVGYFDCYKSLVMPLWLYGWNPSKIRVRWQKFISTTCFITQLIFYIVCGIISFSQHYDTSGDAILVMLFFIDMTIVIIKHCGLLFCRNSFETVVDYFHNNLTPEEQEYQTVIKNKTKHAKKTISAYLGLNACLLFLIILVPIIKKYFFAEHKIIVPILQADIITRSFTLSVVCLSGAMYDCLYISFCGFIIAHIEVLICQISQIKYERGFDKSDLRKSLKKVMKRHASILRANELRCKAFYWILFMQLSVSTACICFALINPEETNTLIILPGQIIEICLFCHFGQKVENKSEEISLAYYSTPWPEMDPPERKLILVALSNSQKPLHTSGGPFNNLSHTTLKNVLHAAYSYYAVLKEIK